MNEPSTGAPLVLVVDDFEDNREMYAEFLSYSGYRVAQAGDGKQAIEAAFELHPDLILMDLSLPEVDGWEATRRLKGDDRTRDIPIVALSGHTRGELAEDAARAGCDVFLTKPCMPDTLVETIRSTLERSLSPKDAAVSPDYRDQGTRGIP